MRGIYERLGPLTNVLLGARSGNTELQEIREAADAQRLHAATLLAGAVRRTGRLRDGLDDEHAREAIWALNSPELHSLLAVDRGWSADDYEAALTDVPHRATHRQTEGPW